MTLQTAGAVVAVITALGTMIVAIYKLRPESNKIFVDTAKVSIEMAKDDVDDLQAKLDRERAERVAEKIEHDKYRTDAGAHMAELAAALRSERAEKKHCHAEMARLNRRVRELEGGTS